MPVSGMYTDVAITIDSNVYGQVVNVINVFVVRWKGEKKQPVK